MSSVCDVETAVVPALTTATGMHSTWHLVVVLAGGMDQERGRQIYSLGAGSCRLSPPHRRHHIQTGSDGLTCAIATLDEAWIDGLSLDRDDTFVSMPSFGEALEEALSEEPGWSGKLRRELGLRRALAAISAERGGRDPDAPPTWLADAQVKMREAPQSCQIGRLVEQSCVSRVHFSRMFRKHFGLKPVEFRTVQRLLHALHLLQETDAPIAHVAQESGFADQSHLVRALGLKLGITPSLARGG